MQDTNPEQSFLLTTSIPFYSEKKKQCRSTLFTNRALCTASQAKCTEPVTKVLYLVITVIQSQQSQNINKPSFSYAADCFSANL